MKLKYFIGILVTILLVAFLFRKDREATLKHEELEAQAERTAPPFSNKVESSLSSSPSEKNPVADISDSNSKPVELNTEQKVEVEKSFANHIKQISQCLGVQVATDQDKLAPSAENVITSIKGSFGDVLVKMDDWNQYDIKAADGSRQRIRTENEYIENNTPTTRVQLFKINAQGFPELQPLNQDLATNPSEEYLRSLVDGGQTTVEEKGSRAYFGEGEELVIVEKNGILQSFTLTKGEKTISCTGTDSLNSSCQCL